MEQEPKFVAFNLDGFNHIDQMSSLLKETIIYMNKAVQIDPSGYNKLSGSDVEKLSLKSLKEIAPTINFSPDRIELISGHIFPDILLHKTKYGVEIKSTQKDAWTSTGSSIVESTRDKDAERIYMLFGKLGGQPEFRCKPYQLCLSNIAVTHSPRYLIDMNLTSDSNIFAKMNTDYEVFRHLDEGKKISCVRQYYIKKAKAEKKYEMPWWMGETTNVNLSFYNDLPASEKNILQVSQNSKLDVEVEKKDGDDKGKRRYWGKLIRLYPESIKNLIITAESTIIPAKRKIGQAIETSKVVKNNLSSLEPQVKEIVKESVYKDLELYEIVSSQKLIAQISNKIVQELEYVLRHINSEGMSGEAITAIRSKVKDSEKSFNYYGRFIGDCFGN